MAAVQERGLKEMMNPVSCQTPSQSRQPAASPPPIALRGEDCGRAGENMNFSQQEAALMGSSPHPLPSSVILLPGAGPGQPPRH